MILEYSKDNYRISTDKSKLQIEVVHHFLTNSYWAKNIPMSIMQKSIENSLCYGVYHRDKQIGFARVVTDYATFGYLADVFILEEYRGNGLSKWLMKCLLQHPDLQHIRVMMLKTKDAHGLYSQFGFIPPEEPGRIMEKKIVRSYLSVSA